jgi:peptidoglycan/LPS O-acetylase OafA/YrhL
MEMRFVLTLSYGLFMIWTGLLRSIEAQAFKPNAFYFCIAIGSLAIVSAFLFRSDRKHSAVALSAIASATALIFYVGCFVGQPEKDATVRVALAIVASVAQLCVIATACFGRASKATKN